MKRTLATLAAAAGMLVWTGALGVATHSVAEPSQSNSHTVAYPHSHPRPAVGYTPNWEEDEVPVELYLWARCNVKMPCYVHRVKGKIDNYVGCWEARAPETTLYGCPPQKRGGQVIFLWS